MAIRKPCMRIPLCLAASLLTALGCAQRLDKFSEVTVAGGPNDLMIVRHIVISGSNEAIGRKLAEIARDEHHARLIAMGAKDEAPRLKWFSESYPEVIERSKGVSEVFGVRAGDLELDTTSLPYDLDFTPGCSVIYYPGASVSTGHAMLSRNYDFPKASYAALTGRRAMVGARSMTGDPYVIEMHPDHGYAALFTCAYDLLGGAIDGVNEKGVTVALLADDASRNRHRGTPYIGLGEVDLPRFVLDKCASVKEAKELLAKVPYYSTFVPCHYIIGDTNGDSMIFEVSADGKHYFLDGGGKPQIVTNHSIAEYGTQNLPQGNSFDRYRRLQSELGKRNGVFTPAEVKEINYCVAVPAGVRVAATMWHAVYDLSDKSVDISFCLSQDSEASERRSPYLHFKLGG